MNTLTDNDIDVQFRDKVYVQDYTPKQTIDGVRVIELKEMVGEDSNFSELMRLSPNGESEQFPGFTVAQINRSTQIPGSIKAWHLHYIQDEVWCVPDEARLLTGLWDVRESSPTKGMTMRIPMGGGSLRAIFIPHGVAHGSANLSSETSIIIYFMNMQFDIKNPDEHRIPWDTLGKDFWSPQRD